MQGEIKVETASAEPMPKMLEWFLPVFDWEGSGVYWSTCQIFRTKAEAEGYILNLNPAAKQARIIRLMLPCKVIE